MEEERGAEEEQQKQEQEQEEQYENVPRGQWKELLCEKKCRSNELPST